MDLNMRRDSYWKHAAVCVAALTFLLAGAGRVDSYAMQDNSYRAQAQVLRGRINELKEARAKSEQAWEKDALSGRIGILETLWREARDQAVLLEHYYDRGYRRNGHYTL